MSEKPAKGGDNKKVKELQDELDKARKDLQKKTLESDEKLTNLNKQLEQSKMKFQKLTQLKSEEAAAFQAQIKKAKDESQEQQKRADQADSEKFAKEKQIKTIERTIKTAKEETDEIKNKQKDLEFQLESQKNIAREKDQKIKEWQSKNDDMIKKQSDFEAKKAQDEQKVKSIENTMSNIVRENDKLVGELENRTTQMNFKLETWIEKAQYFKGELDALKSENKHLEHNLRIEKEKKDEYKVQLNSIQNQLKEFEDLQRKYKQKDKYCTELEEEIDNLKRTIRKNPGQLMMDYDSQNTQELVFRLQNDVRILQMEADTRRHECDQWRQKALDLEHMMDGKKNFEQQKYYLEREIKDRDDMIRNLKERLEIAQKEIEGYRRGMQGQGGYYQRY